MTLKLAAASLGALLLSTQFAAAIEMSGAQLSFSHLALTDDSSVSTTSIHGSVEIGFSNSISAQIDLGSNQTGSSGPRATNAVVHAIFQVNDKTQLGAFYGFDRVQSTEWDLTGMEFAHRISETKIEGYASRASVSGLDFDTLGLSLYHPLPANFGIGASVEQTDFISILTITRYGLQTDYRMTENLSLFAELGMVEYRAFGGSNSENFFSLGGEIAFGRKSGTTFAKRSIFNTLIFPDA